MRKTSKPAMVPASLVAWRWASLKYAGTGDDGLLHFLAQIVFDRLLHLLQDHGRDFRWRVFLAIDFGHGQVAAIVGHFVGDFAYFVGDFAVAAAHEALDRIDRVLRVGDGLALGGLADEALAVFGETDHGGRGAAPFRVGDYLASWPSMTATHELVVPKSMPMTLAMMFLS